MRVCRGQRPWYVYRVMSGTWEVSKPLRKLRSSNQPKRRYCKGNENSDLFIVLRERESRLQGEGRDRSMHQSKETNAGQVEPDKHLQTSLNDIERKARYKKDHKFENLCGLLNTWNLAQSWQYVNKKAAKGIDKVSAREFGVNLIKEVTVLENELKKGAYHANLVRRTFIEKSNGDKRPLGIPTVRDKLLQTTCSKILEAIYEPKFYGTRYGYRKGKGAKDAVKHLGKELNFGRYGYIVEADIKGYFQNINHDKLLEMLAHDIADKKFVELIRKWLKAGIMTEENVVEKPYKGTPQGGVISPILANIYLHYILDLWFEEVVMKRLEGESTMIAYADDFVCAFRYRKDAERFMDALERRFNKFGLELAREKTKLIKFSRFSKDRNGEFDFLGFTFKWKVSRKDKDIITHTTSKKKFNASVQKMKRWIKENRNCRLRKLIDQMNIKLKGYYNYYGLVGNYKMLEKMDLTVKRILYKWMNRRSQRRSFNWREFSDKLKRNYPIQRPFIESLNKQLALNI